MRSSASKTIAALLAVAVASGIWVIARRANSPAHRLPAAAAGQRTVEGYLTGFSHAPFSRTRAGGDNVAVLTIAGELQRAARTDPTPANLQAYGSAQLLLGRFDDAVATLQSAARGTAGARLLSDLAVGHLALASSSDRADELPRAAEALEQALAINPRLAQAWFTKAIVLEKLRMSSQAREAWETYLKLDPRSGWRDEARARLAALTAVKAPRWEDVEQSMLAPATEDAALNEAVARYPMDIRDAVVRTYLPAWAGARDPMLQRELRRRLDQLIGYLEQKSSDRFFSTVLDEVDRLTPDRLHAFKAAVCELGDGLTAQAAERPTSEVRSRLEEAAAALHRLPSTLAFWADFTVARLDAVAQQHDALARRAEAVIAQSHAGGFAALEARARLQLGMSAFSTSRWSDAAMQYDEAIRLCERTGEDALASNIHTNAAVLSRFLGNRLGTWQHREQAGRMLPGYRPLQVHLFLTSGAATASVETLPLTALLFQNEVIGNARSRLSAGPLTEAYIARARMLVRVGQHAAARRDLDEASKLMNDNASEAMRRRFERAWLLGSAEVHLVTDPGAAASEAARAVSFITSTNEPVRLAEVALVQSRALSKLGRLDEAGVALQRGLTAFEAALRSIDPRDLSRVAALEPVWGLYSEATRLSLVPGHEDFAAAFEMYERGRARTHLDLRKAQPVGLTEAQRRLRPDEGILLLDQSSEDLVTWWVDRDGVNVTRAQVTGSQLDVLVATQRDSVEAGQRRSPSSSKLFDLAVRPHWAAMRKKRIAAVITDGSWSQVVWPALWDSISGVELVAALPLVMAPSATVALTRHADTPAAAGSALIVSAADVNGGGALPGARAEATAVAAVYAHHVLLDGSNATPAKVLDLARTADVLHVSSHANSAASYPQLSHLVLAGPQGGDRLFVGDITAVDLSPVRLVVLAACATVGRSAVRGEGSVGVAWAFLTAGAGAVIGTLQDVQDDEARRFFPEVHRRIAAGSSAAEALHAVQREWAQAGEPPRMWASVAVFGSL